MTVRPLVYLSVRSVVNGVKRAFSSGKRMVSLLMVVLYYIWMFVRPVVFSNNAPQPRFLNHKLVEMPNVHYIEAVVFCVFAALTFFLMLGSGAQRSSFKQADMDVLFPTPVDPWHVMLFRLILEYFVTLLLPLVFALLGFRSLKLGLGAFIENFPEQGGLALRLLGVTWLLLSAFWVSFNYCSSLWLNRSDDPKGLRYKWYANGLGGAGILLLGYAYYVGRDVASFDQFVIVAQKLPFRLFFFSASLGTQFVMAPLQKNPGGTILYGGLIVTGIAAALYGAYRQRSYLYDQISSKSNIRANVREMSRKGDLMGAYGEMARQGKVKARQRWISNVRVSGLMALVWKDILIQLRSGALGMVMSGIISVMLLFFVRSLSDSKATGPLFMTITGVFMFSLSSMTSQVHAVEMLKRVDFHKPLPFSSMQMALADIFAGSISPSLSAFLPSVLGLAMAPAHWQWFVAGMIAFPTLALVIGGSGYAVTVIFPDYDDPTQRGFRGLMYLLGLAIVVTPGIAAMVGLTALFKLPILAATVWSGFNLAVAFGLALVCGYFYDGFNPNE